MTIEEVRIILRGAAKDQAPAVLVRYRDELGNEKVKTLEEADLTKVVFSSGEEGELWFDIFSGIEADEGIE